MDLLALGGLALGLAASLAALHEARAERNARAAVWLALTALALQAPLSWRFELAPWDERYHALVAKHVADGRLVPTLVADPIDDAPSPDWRTQHVFLHKPPVALWVLGAARALFGAREVAVRVPSALARALLVLGVFALGRRFVSERAALAAAGFAAWNGRLGLLAAGLRATDHVDTLFTLVVALGALAALRAAEALSGERPRAAFETALVGVATGAALLTKDLPALIVPAFFGLALLVRPLPWRARLLAPAAALGLGLALAAPWWLFIAHAFPREAAEAQSLAHAHVFGVVEGHGGSWLFHLALLPRDFGPLAPLALLWLAGRALRGERALLPLVGWFALVYGAFGFSASKMESYVAIASPVVFIALGGLACDAPPAGASALRRHAHALVAVVLAVSALVGVWGALGPLQERVRDPLWARELRWLAGEVAKLPGPRRALFGVRGPIECMFYADATCVEAAADPATRARAEARGFSVAEYGATIPYDPRTLPARELAAALAALGAKRVLVFNARDAADLRAYLCRFLRRTSVSGELPRPGRKLSRAVAKGARVAVLVPPGGEPPDAVRRGFPDATFVESARYAQPAR